MRWHRQPQSADEENGLKTFEVRYRHGGSDWTLELRARDAGDARSRLAGLAEARLAIDEDAHATGPFAAVGHFLRHGLNRLFAVNF